LKIKKVIIFKLKLENIIDNEINYKYLKYMQKNNENNVELLYYCSFNIIKNNYNLGNERNTNIYYLK
jgi:hypothetical protein